MGTCQPTPPSPGRAQPCAAITLAAAAIAVTVSAGCATSGGRGHPEGHDPVPETERAAESEPAAPGAGAPIAIPGVATTPGSVRFLGFDARALGDFRVIPEEGSGTFVPGPGEPIPVDGFWWRFAPRGWWFKIPNHCHVDVIADPAAGSEPSAFRAVPDCDPLAAAILRATGRIAEAGFVPDTGASAHPSDDPFPPLR